MVDNEQNPDLFTKDMLQRTRVRNDTLRGRLFATKVYDFLSLNYLTFDIII